MLVPQLTSGIFLTHRPISPGRTPAIFCGTYSLPENCCAQHFCGSLCNAGTLNDNDSGYTLRENTFQGSYVGQLVHSQCTIILPTFRVFTCIANFNIEDTFFQASYKTKCINILNTYTTFVIQRMWE